MGGSETHAPCPPVVEYSIVDQDRAAVEVEALPQSTVVVRMLSATPFCGTRRGRVTESVAEQNCRSTVSQRALRDVQLEASKVPVAAAKPRDG